MNDYDLFDHSRAERRQRLMRQGQREVLQRLLARGVATPDDVRAAVSLPRGINPVCFGVVPGSLARAGIIASDGFVKSGRPKSHARPIQRWRLVDRTAALHWLGEYPERRQTPPDRNDHGGNGAAGCLFSLNPTQTPSPAAATAGLGMEATE